MWCQLVAVLREVPKDQGRSHASGPEGWHGHLGILWYLGHACLLHLCPLIALRQVGLNLAQSSTIARQHTDTLYAAG
jgi:hypothetical protein